MDTAAMKSAGRFFILTFAFFFLGQVLWTCGIYCDGPFLGSEEADKTWSSHLFTLTSIFGVVASVKLYRACR